MHQHACMSSISVFYVHAVIYDVIAGDHHHVSRKSVEEFVESCGDTVDANCMAVIEELFPSDKVCTYIQYKVCIRTYV